jgi:hypothetical protein
LRADLRGDLRFTELRFADFFTDLRFADLRFADFRLADRFDSPPLSSLIFFLKNFLYCFNESSAASSSGVINAGKSE